MNRRDLITLIGGAAAWPVGARAQQGERVRRIGVLVGAEERDPNAQANISAPRQEFQKLGWAEGQTLRIDLRFASADLDRMRGYAAELVGLAPDVMLGNTPAGTRALQQATKSIPIVFTAVGDPVVAGIVGNTARPEGNATGFTNYLPSFGGKWLELLNEAVPRIARTALVFNPEVSTGAYFAPIEAAAAAMAAKLVRTPYRNGSELETGIDAFAVEPNGAMLVLPPNPTGANQELILRLAVKHKLPAIYSNRILVARGGLMSYDSNSVELYRRAASYVDRLLRGAKISDLPVQFPTKYDLTINLKTAKTLGLTIPPSLLAIADEVIE